jgi:hypothetical protein
MSNDLRQISAQARERNPRLAPSGRVLEAGVAEQRALEIGAVVPRVLEVGVGEQCAPGGRPG